MKAYYKVMSGSKSKYASQCRQEGFTGVDYQMDIDFSGDFPENWRDFNEMFIPEYLIRHPDKSKIAAGLACGTIWVVCYHAKIGDVILSPDGKGNYMIGEFSSDYHYKAEEVLPHRRGVNWYDTMIEKDEMSDALQSSIRSAGTYSNLTDHAQEIESLINPKKSNPLSSEDGAIEDFGAFALEKHLEDFLVLNWQNTELGKEYDIYQDEGELVGQQFPSDTGPIDILAISKDKKTLLVIELKKGRASDRVIGQIQRYMGYVKEELAEPQQVVKGIIIALEDDLRIKRALAVTQSIEFYRYQISFKLLKGH
ncbi:MAG: endonuclease NucS domain-containing protein [Bacteroidota bacterium]